MPLSAGGRERNERLRPLKPCVATITAPRPVECSARCRRFCMESKMRPARPPAGLFCACDSRKNATSVLRMERLRDSHAGARVASNPALTLFAGNP